MYELTNVHTVKELLTRHKLALSKSRGQNFLINPTVCPRMASECGANKNDGIIEIGPGVGVLTAELCKTAKRVVTIELDNGLIPVLNETLSDFDNVKIIHGDAMKINLKQLISDEFGDMKVYLCANLPYYITTPIIMMLLEQRLPIEGITVMVQKEFAQRLCANVGTRESGAVTVSAAYYAHCERLFGVNAASFLPPPKVDSEVIRLVPHKVPPVNVENEKLFFSIVKAGFAQRRKTMQNALFSGLNIEKKNCVAALEAINLPAAARIEQLTLEDLAAVANYLQNI